jgi:hypothetical protein
MKQLTFAPTNNRGSIVVVGVDVCDAALAVPGSAVKNAKTSVMAIAGETNLKRIANLHGVRMS